MERVTYDAQPYVRGTDPSPDVKGRMITVPGGEGITVSELVRIVKQDAPNVYLSDIRLVGGHAKWERLETADEAAARATRFVEREQYVREGRYKAYLKMKEEFGD